MNPIAQPAFARQVSQTMTMKRPASASLAKRPAQEVAKKPAKGTRDGAEAMQFAPDENLPAEEGPDTRPISKKQRHVWERAMAALPGTEKALPDNMRQAHAEAKASTERGKQCKVNAIINAVVPRDAGYALRINFKDKVNCQKFHEIFTERKNEHQIVGLSEANWLAI